MPKLATEVPGKFANLLHLERQKERRVRMFRQNTFETANALEGTLSGK